MSLRVELIKGGTEGAKELVERPKQTLATM